MEIGDIVHFKFNKKYHGQAFMVMSGKYYKPHWKSPKVRVVRVSDGKQLFFISVSALEKLCK